MNTQSQLKFGLTSGLGRWMVDGRPARRSHRPERLRHAADHFQLRGDRRVRGTTAKRQTADGGDRGQRLAPEAERRDAEQIVGVDDLAGRVTR